MSIDLNLLSFETIVPLLNKEFQMKYGDIESDQNGIKFMDLIKTYSNNNTDLQDRILDKSEIQNFDQVKNRKKNFIDDAVLSANPQGFKDNEPFLRLNHNIFENPGMEIDVNDVKKENFKLQKSNIPKQKIFNGDFRIDVFQKNEFIDYEKIKEGFHDDNNTIDDSLGHQTKSSHTSSKENIISEIENEFLRSRIEKLNFGEFFIKKLVSEKNDSLKNVVDNKFNDKKFQDDISDNFNYLSKNKFSLASYSKGLKTSDDVKNILENKNLSLMPVESEKKDSIEPLPVKHDIEAKDVDDNGPFVLQLDQKFKVDSNFQNSIDNVKNERIVETIKKWAGKFDPSLEVKLDTNKQTFEIHGDESTPILKAKLMGNKLILEVCSINVTQNWDWNYLSESLKNQGITLVMDFSPNGSSYSMSGGSNFGQFFQKPDSQSNYFNNFWNQNVNQKKQWPYSFGALKGGHYLNIYG